MRPLPSHRAVRRGGCAERRVRRPHLRGPRSAQGFRHPHLTIQNPGASTVMLRVASPVAGHQLPGARVNRSSTMRPRCFQARGSDPPPPVGQVRILFEIHVKRKE